MRAAHKPRDSVLSQRKAIRIQLETYYPEKTSRKELSLSRFLSGMMRLSHHNTVTGGTTHGRCTLHRAAVPSDGVSGFHQRDPRRVSAAGPPFRGRVPRPDGGVADGWETTDCAPVYRLQKLSSPDTRRSAVVHLLSPAKK